MMFVGRTQYIEIIMKTVRSLYENNQLDSPHFITVEGPGGIGKTRLLTEIKVRVHNIGMLCSKVNDLKATANRSVLSILTTLANGLDKEVFQEFYNLVNLYNNAHDTEKSSLYIRCIEIFESSCRIISIYKPLVFLFDTFETVHNTDFERWLIQFCLQLEGRILVIMAGRNSIAIESRLVQRIQLVPFTESESEELAHLLYTARGIEYDLDSSIIQKIHIQSSGKPILLILAIEWILENARPEYIITLPQNDFEKHMVLHIRRLKDIESLAIMMMATADRRFDKYIMSILTDNSSNECEIVCKNIIRFSFVKFQQEDSFLVLHDEMLRLVVDYIDLPHKFKSDKLRKLVTMYYEQEINKSVDKAFRQILVAEKIHYMIAYSPSEAIQCFDREMINAIQEYNFDYCSLLLDEVERYTLPRMEEAIIELNRAELELKRYRPVEARLLTENLIVYFNPEDHPVYYLRALHNIAGSIINPCTLIEADPFEAITLWQQAIDICQNYSLKSRIPEVLYQLGYTYALVGQHELAEKAFLEAYTEASQQQNLRLLVQILDELGNFYRVQQSLTKALNPLQESLNLKHSIHNDHNLGISYYYLGNIFRDMDDFQQAHKYYITAEKYLMAINDDFVLSELYNDISWMYRLEEDLDKAKLYLEKSYSIANSRNFGTMLSEYWHIAYELAMLEEKQEDAYLYLDKALEYAYKYINVYMILDCLNHAVQRAYTKKQFEEIPKIIEEMMTLENRGCGIRVFRGRAMMVYGDYYYDMADYEKAISTWKEALTIIALYGNSRTNVELFDDIFEQRKDRIRNALGVLSHITPIELRDHWIKQGLGNDFPAVVELCNTIGSV